MKDVWLPLSTPKQASPQVSGRTDRNYTALKIPKKLLLKSYQPVNFELVEQALAHSLAEQFGVMLKTTLQEAITKQMQKENNRAANLALEAFYSAEHGRILTIYLLRFLLGEDIEILPQIIKESQEQARENMKRFPGEGKEHNQLWQ